MNPLAYGVGSLVTIQNNPFAYGGDGTITNSASNTIPQTLTENFDCYVRLTKQATSELRQIINITPRDYEWIKFTLAFTQFTVETCDRPMGFFGPRPSFQTITLHQHDLDEYHVNRRQICYMKISRFLYETSVHAFQMFRFDRNHTMLTS